MDSIKIKLNTGDDFIIKKLKVHSFTNIIIHPSVKQFNEIYVFVLRYFVSVVKTLIKSKLQRKDLQVWKISYSLQMRFFQMPDTVFDVGGK